MTDTPVREVVTARDAVRLLAKVVRPTYPAKSLSDYVYTSEHNLCQNFDSATGEPRCIVGHVVSGLGYTVFQCGNSDATHTLKRINSGSHTHTFTAGALLVLMAAQGVQDNGGTWGQALEAARSVNSGLDFAENNAEFAPIGTP